MDAVKDNFLLMLVFKKIDDGFQKFINQINSKKCAKDFIVR